MLRVADLDKRLAEARRTATLPPRAYCFDFFDTLVTRAVAPEHTKRLAARRLALLLGGSWDCHAIYEARREIEATLCRENIDLGRDSEFSFAALGRRLYQTLDLGQLPFFQRLGQEGFVSLFLEIEVAVEKSVQRPCVPTCNLIRSLKQQGFTVCLVSDFYLPGERFRELLLHHGMADLFDHVFVSADYGLTKGGGRLYDVVAERLGLAHNQICMVGDNDHSDIRMACDRGMHACRVDAAVQRQYYRRWQERQQDDQENARTLERELRRVVRRRAGDVFPELSLSLWLFTLRLLAALVRDGVTEVFFCSKEGEFLKKLFDRVQQELFGRPVVITHYLLVSRKATFIGSLRPLPAEDFSRLFSQYPVASILEFLQSLNIDRPAAQKLCRDLCIEGKQRIVHLDRSRPFMELVSSRMFVALYENTRRTQKEGFLRYLASFDSDLARRGMALVDVGWKGSIQDNIFFMLGGDTPVNGYYLGLNFPEGYTHPAPDKNRKQGILFSNQQGESPYFSVFNTNRSLMEMALGASHGSADGYFSPEEQERLSRLHQGDTTGQESAGDPLRVSGSAQWRRVGDSAAMYVRLLDLPEERQLYSERIRPLQERLLAAVLSFSRIHAETTAAMPTFSWFARRHGRMVFFPSSRELDLYQSLYHLENFGIFRFTRFAANTRHTWRQRFRAARDVWQRPETCLENGTWPPVLLRRMGVGGLIHLDGLRRWRRAFGRGPL